MKYTKVFNGKRYDLMSRPGTKKLAQRDAKNMGRSEKFSIRTPGTPRMGYSIWRKRSNRLKEVDK